VPVKLDNDANATALAETRWGAARGYRYVFYATVGTGIGTGIVFDGRIYHGRTRPGKAATSASTIAGHSVLAASVVASKCSRPDRFPKGSKMAAMS
jgi:predicted NBD/HSP70 family sugar kinase